MPRKPAPRGSSAPPSPEFSEEERRKLLAVLASENITQLRDPGRIRTLAFALVRFLTVIFACIYGWAAITVLLRELLGNDLLLITGPCMIVLGIAIYKKRLKPELITAFAQTRWGQNVEKAIYKTKMAPILYLRSFDFDADAHAIRKGARYLKSTAELQLAVIAGMGTRGTAVPLLAIGKPGVIQPPSGALRFWVKEHAWRDTIAALAPLCSLTIWVTGHTEGLDWEIRYLIANLPPTKLVLWNRSQVTAASNRKADWRHFVDQYSEVFPGGLPDDMAESNFVLFDENWIPLIVTARRAKWLDPFEVELVTVLTERIGYRP